MSFISSTVSSTSLSAYPGQSVESATGSISSLLLALLARAKRITGSHTDSNPKAPSKALRESMTRIPADELQSVVPESTKPRRKKLVRSRQHENDERSSKPQPIVTDSVPLVHDRLPDPMAWNIIDKKLEEMETASYDSIPSKVTFQRKTTAEDAESSSVTTQSSNTETIETEVSSNLPTRASPKSAKRAKRSKRGIYTEMAGVLRRRQMYCSTGFHVQIMKGGRVTATREDHNQHAILEFISVGVGLVSIRGVVSGLYLAMDGRGRLYGSDGLCDDCKFREELQENWYNTYSSVRHKSRSGKKSCLVSLGRKHRNRHDCRTNSNHRSTHFLPRAVDPDRVPSLYMGILH